MAKATKTSRRKNPNGGLTPEGRRHLARKEGAHLKPGVKTVGSPEDMRRKGSFLRRHYGGRAKLSPLAGKDGKPTRYALQAHAWGEPIPKTATAVRRLAKKGAALLDRYRRLKAGPKNAKKRKG